MSKNVQSTVYTYRRKKLNILKCKKNVQNFLYSTKKKLNYLYKHKKVGINLVQLNEWLVFVYSLLSCVKMILLYTAYFCQLA